MGVNQPNRLLQGTATMSVCLCVHRASALHVIVIGNLPQSLGSFVYIIFKLLREQRSEVHVCVCVCV